jgi:PAS domain S-box-containing protein
LVSLPDDEEVLLRSVALQNASSILRARQRAEAELLRTKEALRESQERLTAALMAAGTGTFRWDFQTDTVEWDGNLDRLFGLEPGGKQSLRAFTSAVHPDDRDGVAEHYLQCARDGSDFDREFRVVRPDGSARWISQKAKTFVDDDGKPLYMTGACADITARKQVEESLRHNEERLRTMFNQAAVGIALATLEGRVVDINEKFSEVLGYSAEEIRDTPFIRFTHPDDVAETRSVLNQLLAGTRSDIAMEKRYLRKDGSEIWSRTTLTLLKDADGRPRQFLGVIEDITPRKRAEAALQEESRILELLNETGKSLASQLDLQSLLQAVTDAATQLSGAQFGAFFYNTQDENGDAFLLYTLSGAPREAFEKFGKPRATALFGPTFRGDAPIRCDDVLQDPRYGKWGPHHGMPKGHLPVRSYLAVPVRSRGGAPSGGLFFGHSQPGVFTERAERLVVGVAAQAGIAIDNARLYEAAQKAAAERQALLESERAARAAAERLSELKDEFLATLSHELRTPLTAILGWSQILRRNQKTPQEYSKGLQIIERNARLQTQLIEDLLDMSRITSGKLRLEVQLLQPVLLVEAALETVKPAAEAKGIRLERFLDPTAGVIAGDPGRLQQVLWNLLSNAIKFTPKDGKVQVLLEQVNSQIEISVADTGIGIDPKFIPHLFERFRQGDASTTRKYGGLGLGLSIVKSLVELHGGTVRVTSPGVDQGTTVSLQLPLGVHREPSPLESPPPKTSSTAARDVVLARLGGLRILVVDDHADARELVTRLLEECGAEVLTAGSVEEAVAVVEAQRLDLLISDIGMPGSDGFELLRRVRALGKNGGGALPALALTAFARSEDRTRALRAGFLVHLAKPIDPSALIATVARITRRMDEAH